MNDEKEVDILIPILVIGTLSISQLLLIVLKISKVLDWHWLLILLPIILTTATCVGAVITLMLGSKSDETDI